jgi:hypothetical protein
MLCCIVAQSSVSFQAQFTLQEMLWLSLFDMALFGEKA